MLFLVSQNLKCPQCGLSKFRQQAKQIEFKGKTEAENIKMVILICSTCGNVMFNANPISKFKSSKSDSKYKLTK